jgi:diguanylate cyclase (GGDEF)-like protein/PAS domain S-box-containing protein
MHDLVTQASPNLAPERLAACQQLMLELAISFINLPVQDFDEATNAALGRMATFFHADRAYVFSYDAQSRLASNTHEWCAPGVSPAIHQSQEVHADIMPDWTAAHHRGEPVLVADVSSLPRGPLRELLEAQHIRSLLTAPLVDGDDCVGFVGFDAVHSERHFSEGEYEMLAIFASLLVSIEQRRRTARELDATRQSLSVIEERFQSAVVGSHAAAKAVEESERRYRRLFDHSRDALIIVEPPDWRLVTCNAATLTLFGFPDETSLMDTFSIGALSPPRQADGRDSAQAARAALNRALEQGDHFFEWQHLHRDGRVIDCSVLLNRTEWSGRTVIQGTVRDISQRKAAERALHQRTEELTRANRELEQLATVFTHANEGITITDPDAMMIQVNDALCEMSGYSREELIGENPRLLRSDKHPLGFYLYVWNQLIETGHWKGEVWFRRKQGEDFAVNLTISSVFDESGRVLHHVALATDITDQISQQEQLERIAHYDAVTQLPNRILLARELQQAMAQARRQNTRIAIAYLDLDGFKAVNDQHGHDVGDQLLAVVARNMRTELRSEDTLARLGGDEFVVVFTSLDDDRALRIALRRLLHAASTAVELDGRSLHVSASLGVALYPQAEALDADQLLRQADQAMYQAKLAGKNRYVLFDTHHHHNMIGQNERISRIEKALQQDEFTLYYQPKVNMRSGEVIGLEALIRWQHPESGLLSPAEFLPVIQSHPLSTALDAWVLDAVLAQSHDWQTRLGRALPISLNLGAMTLQHGRFATTLKERLERWPRYEQGLLEIEILESSALEDIDSVIGIIRSCRELGVRFALDDFGVGYSSLTYLKRLPADTLKIDQSFVRDMLNDPDDLAILRGILGLAEVFERRVIAEGVETIAHGERLLDLGCECAQGYGIARPMPADQVPQWLDAWRAPSPWLRRQRPTA